MTTPQVWVSATSQDIDYDGHTPGSHWDLVGEIDTVQESNFLPTFRCSLSAAGL